MSTLNKDNDWTELDEQFKNLMKKMMEETSDFYEQTPNGVDYLFLDKVPKLDKEFGVMDCVDLDLLALKGDNQAQRKKMDIAGEKRGKKFWGFTSKIAVIAMGVLLAGSGMAIWINSDPANAMKFQIEKKFYQVSDGVFSTDDGADLQTDSEGSDESCITLKYKSMEDIDKAKKFMPDLPVPEYIPEGYELNNLRIDQTIDDVFTASYVFENINNFFCISIIKAESESSYQLNSNGEIIKCGDKEVCMWEDMTTGNHGCSFLLNEINISVSGQISKKEMLQVIKEIN